MYTKKLYDGVDIHVIEDKKFAVESICLLFRLPLKKEWVTGDSLVATMLMQGCKKYPSSQEIELRLEEICSSMSSNVVKKGEEHIVELFCKTVPEFVEEVAELMGDIIDAPLFNNRASAEKELESIIKDRINDKRTYALESCIETMCEREPFGINGDGYIEDIKNVDIREHYKHIYENAKVDVIAVGPVATGDMTALMAKALHLMPRHPVIEPCNYMYYPSDQKNVDVDMDITQGKLCVGIRLNIDPTSSQWYRAVVANELFGGSASSALFNNAREAQSLCYYISSRLFRFKSIMIIEAGIDSENKDKVLDIINESFNNISEDGMKSAIKSLVDSTKSLSDRAESLMDRVLGGLLSGKAESTSDVISALEAVDTIKNVFDESIIDTVFMLKGGSTNA